jgi:sulfite exporter TauE/SafE
MILIGSALSLGFIHTLIGPDHYLPFIVIGKARKWSTGRTIGVTFLCGLGHVLSSVIIGAVGILAGSAIGKLEFIEGIRGDIASYTLIGFGLIYGIWGIWRGRKGNGHIHLKGGKHLDPGNVRTMTFWTLFIIFVLGPCEPLIPLLMFPAVSHNWYGVILVTIAFGAATISTMSVIVFIGLKGLANIRIGFLEQYIHALAGGIIAFSGMAIKLFGI